MSQFIVIDSNKVCGLSIMALRVVEFSMGDTKLARFLPKNQQTQRKLLNFGLTTSCQKVSKFDFQS